jgi:hypothetical protein
MLDKRCVVRAYAENQDNVPHHKDELLDELPGGDAGRNYIIKVAVPGIRPMNWLTNPPRGIGNFA